MGQVVRRAGLFLDRQIRRYFYTPSPRTQLSMDARSPIRPVVFGMDGADLAHGLLLFGPALGAGCSVARCR